MENVFVRVQPYNPRKGFNLVRFHDGERLWIGGLLPRWAKVTSAQAERLRGLHQDHYQPDSPLAFQIVSDAERLQIDQEEEDRRRVQIGLLASGGFVPPAAKPAPVDLTGGRSAAIPASRDLTTETLPREI